MNYEKLHKRIDYMLEFENDNYIANINLKQEVSSKLYDYQLLHIFNLIAAIRSNNVIMDGSDTGTGKTYTSIALCKQLNLRPFIICPKIIISNWLNVCKHFNVNPITVINYEMIKNIKSYDANQKVKCKYINVDDKFDNEYRYRWKLPKNSIIIFDEVHRCRNIKTQNAKLLMSTKQGTRNIQNKVLMLSATISDTPKSFHIFGYMLGFYKNLRQARNWINGMLREDKNYIGTKPKLSAINQQIYPLKGSRIRITELGDKFPDNQVSADCYNINSTDRDEVNVAFEKICINNNILKSKLEDNTKGNILKEIIKSRQKIEKIKVGIIEELIDEYLDNGYNVAVFVNFKKTLENLANKYNTDCVIHGNQTNKQRDINISKFQENKTNLIICNIKTGSSSISLHDKYGVPRVSLISPSFSSIEFQQTLGRIHRAGSKTPALQRIIYCAGTCEEVICDKIKKKLRFLSKLNDNDLIKIN